MAESSFKAPKLDIPVVLRKVRNIKKTTLFFAFYVALSLFQTSSVYGEDVDLGPIFMPPGTFGRIFNSTLYSLRWERR
jgi:hypothetical protein